MATKIDRMSEKLSALTKFSNRTSSMTRKFGKLAKKMDGSDPEGQKRKVNDFIKKDVLGIWNDTFMEEFYTKEEIDRLGEDKMYVYIFGAFVLSHSKEVKDIQSFYRKLLVEMEEEMGIS